MSDLISRQAAIDAIYGITAYKGTIPLGSAIFNINKIPAAQPEIIRCKDCKYRGVGDYCVYGTRLAWVTKSNDFCSKAERRTDE